MLSPEQKRHIAIAIDQLVAKVNRSTAEEIALNVLKSILPKSLPTGTQLIGMIGLKMENTYLQALTSIKSRQETTQKHARW